MTAYEQMTDSEQRKLTFRYAEVMRFIQMREEGTHYLPEDMPSLDELRAEMAEMDTMFREEEPAISDAKEIIMSAHYGVFNEMSNFSRIHGQIRKFDSLLSALSTLERAAKHIAEVA